MAIKNLRSRNAGPRSATTIQRDAAIGQATAFCAVIISSGQTELLTVSDQNQLLWL
jgi:hypothetical protein